MPLSETISSPRSQTWPASTNTPRRIRDARIGDGSRSSALRMIAVFPPVGRVCTVRNTFSPPARLVAAVSTTAGEIVSGPTRT